MDGSEHAFTAGAMAAAVGLVKVLEKAFDWLAKRKEKDTKQMVILDPDTARLVRESHERVGDVDKVVSLRDQDGIPMVYTPRSYLDNQLKMAEALRDMSRSQDDTTSELESTNRKIDEILSSIKKS